MMTLLRVIVASLVLLNSCSSLALSVEKKSHVSNQKQKTSKMNAFVNGQKTSEIRTEMTELKNAGEPIPAENTVPSKCPLSEDLDRPEPVPELVRCPEYRENSCCSQREDKVLDNDFVSAYEYIYSGCEGCLENFRLLQCAMRCSPNQIDFTTLATKAEDLKRDLKAHVRVCPQTCSRFFASCVNTTARQVFHADDATFCASQGDSASGIQFVVDEYSCINTAGPSYCNGEYIHEISEDDSLSTRQIVKLVSLVAVLLFTVLGGIYMLCSKGPEDAVFSEISNGQEIYTTKLLDGKDV